MDRYPHFTLQARDQYGNVAAYARVTVLDGDSGAAITTYYDDGVTPKTSIITDSQGWADFYTARKKVVSVTVTGTDGTFTIPRIAADTVEDHRQTGDHAPGTITPDQLSFSLPADPDLALHTVMESNTHGLASNEYFACTKAGTASAATSSPDFVDVTVDSLAVATGGTLHGCVVSDLDRTSIVAAIASVQDGGTVLLKGASNSASAVTIDTTAGTITISKNITIRGLGDVRIDFTGSNPFFTITSVTTSLENIEIIQSSGSASVIKVTNGNVKTKNVNALSIGAPCVLLQGTGGGFTADQSHFVSDQEAIKTNGVGTYGTIFAERTIFASGDTGGTYYAVNLTKNGAAPTTGHTFVACNITGKSRGLYVDVPDTKFIGCFIEDFSGAGEAVNVTANGTNCYLPSNGNTINGSITDGSSNIVGNTAGWDYDSGIVTVDNSGSTYTDEYLAQTFTHNLGSVNLEASLLLANTVGFNDKVWTIPVGPTVVYNTNNHAHGALAFSLCYTSTNAAKLVLYAGESRTGGSITTSGDYLFNAVDPSAIVANVAEDDYNWADAGGLALKTIYVRLRLRRM